uniref:RUN domain-containing protein n=1 Tax=Globodera rostochiensis TaxID=31243 RepID=A0A914HDA7_GLORO
MEASSETGIDNLSSTKRLILRELETTIELVASTSVDFADNQLSGDLTQALCTVVEAILIHGLRDAFFLKGSRHSNKPSPNFWPFVSKYTHRSIKTQISTLNQIHNEIGRARAWIRIVLNEYALDHYISLFSKDTKQMNQFYAVDAFLRDSECISSLDALLKRLNGIRIAAPTNSSLLNAWTPSPLMLAGLIKGTPTVRAHTFRCAVADVPLDVPSSSPSPNGLLSTGKGFRVGSSSPSAASSSAVLLQDDALAAVDAVSMTIASGEAQIVAEFGMEADQLLLVAEQTEGPISVEEQQRQGASSSSAVAAIADDLESVYSHPSMMEDHSSSSVLNSVLVGTSEHHQRRRHNAQNLYSSAPYNSNNKWIMASMPAEELSAEVVVHRKAKQRHRRRTMSRSSCGGGGGSDTSCGGGADGSSSRCQSSANLHTFAESVENKEENASTVTNAEDEAKQHRAVEGTDNVQQQEAPVFEEEMPAFIALNDALSTQGAAMAFDIEQLQQNQPHFLVNSFLPSSPPFGTSLQDELLAAAAAAVAEKEDDGDERFAGEELARKKFSATDEQQQHQQMARDLLINSKIGGSSSAKVSFSYSTDSMDDELLHNNSGSVPAMPATFDEALRNFLGREAQKRRRSSRARTSSSTTNVRLFSECSSSSAGGAAQHEQLQSPSSYPTNLSSPQQLTSSPTTALAQSAAANNGHSATKRELAPEPFKREEREAKNSLDSEEELITVPLPPSVAQQQLQRRPPWTMMSARTTKTYDTSPVVVNGQQQQQVDDADEPYRLPRRLYRLTQIPRELGLDSQEFRCAACRRNIGASFGPFNVCALNGRYYCAGHCIRASGAADNEATLIPARMLLNGDFRPRTVSKESRMLLRSVVDKPFMRLDLLNPHIYAHCTSLRKIKELRLKFSLFVLYLFSCRDSIAEDAKRRIWPQKHWHEDIHLYSIADFESVANGTMERRLNSLINFAQCHVQACTICLQKGFFCELCSASDRPIYPFQTEITYRCPNCASVFHKECARKAELMDATGAANQQQQRNCPKCLRRAKYCSASTMLLLNASPPTTSMMNSISNINDSSSNDSATTGKLPPLSPRDER